MARINIEDDLFKKKSFEKLILKMGSRRTALGALVEAWMLAQRFYLSTVNDRLIPFNEWEREEIADEIIEVGLAERRENGIYVDGSEQQFAWLVQRSEAGKAPKKPKTGDRPITTDNDRSTTVIGSKPLTLSLSLSPSLSQSLTPENTFADSGEGVSASKTKKESPKFDLEKLYDAYPRKEGRKKGLEKLSKIVTSIEIYRKLEVSIRNYVKTTYGTEKRFIKQFSSFVSVWEDYLQLEDNVAGNTNLQATHSHELLENSPYRTEKNLREVENEYDQ